MNKISGLILAVLLGAAAFLPREAYAEPVAIDVVGNTFYLPLQVVDGVQLYSLDEGKGYPAVQTVLASRGDAQLVAGGAPILGTSANVPFVGLQFRLSKKFFDVSDNELHFGAWVGWPSNEKGAIYGLMASVPLW